MCIGVRVYVQGHPKRRAPAGLLPICPEKQRALHRPLPPHPLQRQCVSVTRGPRSPQEGEGDCPAGPRTAPPPAPLMPAMAPPPGPVPTNRPGRKEGDNRTPGPGSTPRPPLPVSGPSTRKLGGGEGSGGRGPAILRHVIQAAMTVSGGGATPF